MIVSSLGSIIRNTRLGVVASHAAAEGVSGRMLVASDASHEMAEVAV